MNMMRSRERSSAEVGTKFAHRFRMSQVLPALPQKEEATQTRTLTRFLYENGLSLILLFTFVALWAVQ